MNKRSVLRRTLLGGLAASSLLPSAWTSHSAPLKVSALFELPFEQLWVSRVHGALRDAHAKGVLTYSGYENIYHSDYVRMLREQAASGVDVIFGESYTQEARIRQVAAEFPKVAFIWSSVGEPQAPNFSVFDNYIHEPAYLAGMVAAEFSKKKHIGVVAGFDMPDIRQIIHAFFAGAKAVNPHIRTHCSFINSWYHLMRAQRASNAMIDQGVDVLLAITHTGVVETASERGIHAINCMANQRIQYPKTVLTAVMWNMQPVVDAVVQRLQSGTYRAESYEAYSLMKEGGSELAPLGPFENQFSLAFLQRLKAKQDAIVSGQFVVKKDSTPVNTQPTS